MTTFKACFTREKLSEQDAQNLKEYTFNSKADVTVGDFFFAEEYNKHLQVVFVFDQQYSYVNVRTGELDKEQKPFPYVKIKEIKIPKKDENKA